MGRKGGFSTELAHDPEKVKQFAGEGGEGTGAAETAREG
jgi:general stress protein YciG